MTNEERDIINQFVARVGGAPQPSGFAQTSVPATQAPALPPVDQEADGLIQQMFQRYPEAAYRMTQLAFVQEQGLIQAQNRIHQLEAQLAQVQQAQQQQQPRQSGGFFGNLFGGGRPQQQPPQQGAWGGQQQQYAPPPGYAPPPPQYAPGYQPGMFQRSGSGFLGSALTTAAGVAGGMVVGSMLTNMFTGGHHGGWASPSPMMDPGGGAWGSPAAGQSAWGTPAQSGQDYVDTGSWDQPQQQDQNWADNSSNWDSGGGDSGSGGSGGDDDNL